MGMNRKEMIISIKGTARRSDKRINSELDEMFGVGKDIFSMEDFENYMRHFVFYSDRHRYSSNWKRNHASKVKGTSVNGKKVVVPGAPVI